MTRGMALGKFLPPHRGHEYMIQFARRLVDELTVQVCTVEREPIPGRLRYEWMRDHFGGVNVVHNDDENPPAPEDDPENFWDIWRESLLRRMPHKPDVVFASEAYGHRLAAELGAIFIPVDPVREMVPVSATMLRDDVIVDTEAIITTMWSRVFCDAVPPEVEAMTQDERYHLYLLTPPRDEWADDGWRVHPDFAKRTEFFEEVKSHLERRNRPYVVLTGTWEERNQQALAAAQGLLKEK